MERDIAGYWSNLREQTRPAWAGVSWVVRDAIESTTSTPQS
jgi:hypothetical protein